MKGHAEVMLNGLRRVIYFILLFLLIFFFFPFFWGGGGGGGESVWPGGRQLSRGTSIRICFGSPFSSKSVVCGHCLVTLSLTINETLS